MDALSFIAAIVAALAWPLTVLGIFLVLRRPLTALIPVVARLRFKDLELDFDRRLAEVSAEAAALPAAAASAGAPTGDAALVALASASPRAAILEAWLRLEATALDAARRRGTSEPVSRLRSPTRLIESLEELGVIDARQAAVFHELRSLRNSAAHALGFEPSPDAARDYVRLAARLERAIVERAIVEREGRG
jgi:hypothetical protein